MLTCRRLNKYNGINGRLYSTPKQKINTRAKRNSTMSAKRTPMRAPNPVVDKEQKIPLLLLQPQSQSYPPNMQTKPARNITNATSFSQSSEHIKHPSPSQHHKNPLVRLGALLMLLFRFGISIPPNSSTPSRLPNPLLELMVPLGPLLRLP